MIPQDQMQWRQAGFSLVELAMVLFIISLVVGGLLVPLSTQMEARQRSDTQARLEEIREALIGFAILNGRLPCPSSVTNPADAGYGLEDATCTAAPAAGYLPWKTLGVVQYDSWGVARSTAADPMDGYWRYVVDTNFACPGATPACDGSTQIVLADAPSDQLRVEDASDNALSSTSAGQEPVAIIYSTGANQAADGDNATNEAAPGPYIFEGGSPNPNFDDIAIWITRPLLISRMVAAGTLP